MWSLNSRSRRAEIRRHRPDASWVEWAQLRSAGVPGSVAVAAGFFALATTILMLRQDVVHYRPGQWISHDILSRVAFSYTDKELLARRRREAAEREPRIYSPAGDMWSGIHKALLQLPDRMNEGVSGKLPADLLGVFDSGAETALKRFLVTEGRDAWVHRVNDYMTSLRDYRIPSGGASCPIFVLPEVDRLQDARAGHSVRVGDVIIDSELTFPDKPDASSPRDQRRADELRDIVTGLVKKQFRLTLQPGIVDFTLGQIRPTHTLNLLLTAEAKNRAVEAVTPDQADVPFVADQPLVVRSKPDQTLTSEEWQLLKAENHAYVSSLKGHRWISKVGVAGICLIVTVLLAAYIQRVQARLVRNHLRSLAIAALLLSMLLLTQLAAIGNSSLYLFGIAPTVLVAMILAIAYEPRFAFGVAGLQGILATVAMDEGMSFFLVILVGALTASFMLDDIRSRSKLIEVGGATALAMAAATAAANMLAYDPWPFIFQNCLYSGAAGLGVGFAVLGILPFVEKAFHITTSMTLLELADVTQPLLRRLALEAAGTYNHSLQVATLSEAAAASIGANSLLCRVGAYYHDVGKIHKADYFIENQSGGENRHLNLNPSVSLMIIIGHVKDGIEMGKEYNLPASLHPFIQQHHGTTLVEYFYYQACQREAKQGDDGTVSEYQYRYPGPKPKSREVAVVMLADAVESACRAMPEPTAGRVETLVHELAMKRLLDGQFDDCELTMRDLETIERSMVKSLMGIYHGRIAYPSMAVMAPPTVAASARTA